MHDPLGAFVPGDPTRREGRGTGPLAGLTFAAKDLFDVAGEVTGCGNPDWAATHPAADRSAWAIDVLLDAGARLVGKTITDEISLGLLGINRHQGTPLNPRVPDLVPGGSSSGSASVVAGGLADIALGSDSGGSVRVPASFCGLYGLRPTHGRLPVDGMMVQAPSFDTVGFFARDAVTFGRVGAVMLAEAVVEAMPRDILIATDAFAIADAPVRDALAPVVARLRGLVPGSREVRLAEGDLLDWARRQRLLQTAEFQATFADWIDRTNPRFSLEVAGAFASAGLIDPDSLAEARAVRTAARTRMLELLAERCVIVLPTVPILPIRRNARLSTMRHAVQRIVDLTGIAGLTGLPQVTLPLASSGPVPVGLSLIGWPGSDADLLGMALAIESSCPAS